MGLGVELAEEATVFDTVTVPMLDGVGLATDVYLPPAAGRVPAVLSRVPYDRRGPLCYLPTLAARYLDRGWAFVAQDVRGKFASEGERVPFVHEVEDGWATLEWIAAQPWCDGRVVMIGDSYCGYTQLAAASSGHPALAAIAPRVTSAEITDDWLFRQGVPCLSTAAAWALFAWSAPDLIDGPWDYARPPHDELAVRGLGRRLRVLDDWFGPAPQHHAQLASWSVPTLHLAGWWDVFRRGQFATWARNRTQRPAATWLHVDATDHQWTEIRRDGTAASGRSASGAPTVAFVDRYLAPINAFFDHVLDGRPPHPAIDIDVVGHGRMTPESWPPPEARPRDLYLVDGDRALDGPEGGGLSPHPDPSLQQVTWVHDPARPVPDLIADPWSLEPGLPDERDVEVRDDVATFTSDELRAVLVIAGPVEVLVDVDAGAPSTHVAAKLVDVDPLGHARRISEGIAAVSGLFPTRAVVDLGHTAYRLERGHRLRLEVASSMFPRFAVHPGTSEPVWSARDRRPSRQVITLGPGRSRLRIWAWTPTADAPT